jgi:trimethylamine--corrinoid protein Co-methyltransferase
MVDPVPVRSMRLESHDVLGAHGAETIHERTLDILDRVGVSLRSERLLGRLAETGARVDVAAGRVRFGPALVEEALARAPARYTLAARDPDRDLPLGAGRGYLGLDGCAAELIDLETGERRASTTADVAEITRLADALPEIAFVWQPVAARDTPPPVAPLHELRAQLASTTKHIQLMTSVTPLAARGTVAMARLAAGGEAELRARPTVSSFQCSVSPLSYEPDAIEAALVFAAAGVPAGFVVMPLAAATGPATPAGVILQANAEVLAGIVMLQLLVPGAPTFYGTCPTVIDIRTGAAAGGGPEDLLFQLAGAQLARRYGVPSSIGSFASGAKASDWQAGTEGALSIAASWLGGADMLCGAGLIHAAATHSSAEVVLDAETFGLMRRFSDGVRLADDDLAADLIEAIGPGGHFLAERHTASHARDIWRPTVFGRDTVEAWEDAGRPSPADRARDRARRILETHEPPALEPGLAAELDALVAAATEEALART